MSEATILKLAEHIVAGVMTVAFFGFLSFVFWLRHIDAAVDAGHKRTEKWRREHGFHDWPAIWKCGQPPKGK